MTTPQNSPEPLITDDGWEPPPRTFRIAPLATTGIALLVGAVAFVSLRAVWASQEASLTQDWQAPQQPATAEPRASPWQPVYSSRLPVEPLAAAPPAPPAAPAPPTPPAATAQPAARPRRAAPPSVPGYLSVSSTPWAEVSVDGRAIGNTPQLRIQLRPGRHELVLTRAGFATHRALVTVGSGATVRVTGVVLTRSTQ